MMHKTTIVLIISLFIISQSVAQRIDNAASFRNLTGKSYFRLHYDNDFWGGTDYYYTQGYNFEFVNPVFRNNPVSALLVRLNGSQSRYGISFEHYGFTPTSIKSDKILRGDRPFAGVIMLKSFSISVDTLKKQRLVSTISTGMIGPAAFAGGMQTTIHRWTGDATPHGWQHQIRNDVVLNYELTHEKEIINIPNLVSLNTSAQARIGTLSNKIQAGFTLTLGRFFSPFQAPKNSNIRNFQVYAYSQPLLGFVGYDATMQGGIFDRKSPYTIPGDQINRVTFQNNFGVAVTFWKIYAEYYRTYLTKEFKTGKDHLWGGVKVGMSF